MIKDVRGVLLKVCAAGILVEDDKILLGKRSFHLEFYPGVWDIIGGHCKDRETPEQTLKRELKEEIGVTPRRFIHVAVLSESEPDLHGEYEYHVYVVIDWSGSVTNLAPHEHTELRWFTVPEAVTLNLAHREYPNLFRNIKKYTK